MLDLMLTDHIFFAGSFGPGFFVGNDKELGFPLEFRSQIEVGRQFTGGQRLAIAFSHTSNAGLSDANEGANALVAQFHQPVASLFGN